MFLLKIGGINLKENFNLACNKSTDNLRKHGEGILYLTDNSQFFGKFIDDKPVGEGFRKKVDD